MKPSDHFIDIYRNHASVYHEMICFEDTDENLRPALESITEFQNKNILDMGTGTGRIPLLFPASKISGLDFHFNMLQENQNNNPANSNFLLQADMRSLPFPRDTFDIITSGWAIGHFTGWYPSTWKDNAAQVLIHAIRTLKPTGWILILETLTTGSNIPHPPNSLLAAYYDWLENHWGFSRLEVRTDYLFETLEQAEYYAQFFFGEEIARLVRKNRWVRLPEWTGIWSKQIKT